MTTVTAVCSAPVLAGLASFSGRNGANPQASVIMDSSGNLYGTTYAGGTYNAGTAFELAKGGGSISTLALFTGGNGGQDPYGGVSTENSLDGKLQAAISSYDQGNTAAGINQLQAFENEVQASAARRSMMRSPTCSSPPPSASSTSLVEPR